LHSSTPSFDNAEKTERRPKPGRMASWDVLGGERPEWEDYDVTKAKVENLRFAQGDVGTTKVSGSARRGISIADRFVAQ
jgi:hypothetical protein